RNTNSDVDSFFFNRLTSNRNMSGIQVNAHIAFFQLSYMESLHVFRNKLREVRNRLFGIVMSIHSLDEMSDFICRNPFFIKVTDKLFQRIIGTHIRSYGSLLEL